MQVLLWGHGLGAGFLVETRGKALIPWVRPAQDNYNAHKSPYVFSYATIIHYGSVPNQIDTRRQIFHKSHGPLPQLCNLKPYNHYR